jgi:hypothetical protein
MKIHGRINLAPTHCKDFHIKYISSTDIPWKEVLNPQDIFKILDSTVKQMSPQFPKYTYDCKKHKLLQQFWGY